MNVVRLAKLLTLLQEYVPVEPADLGTMGIPYQYLGTGAFRDVYWLKGYNAVVKFPMEDTHSYGDEEATCLFHAQQEIDAFDRIRNSRSPLKKHLPVIYYQDREHGVIVMERYKTDWQSAYSTKRSRDLYDAAHGLSLRIAKFFHIPKIHSDYTGDNLGLDKQGNIRIIDLGVC